MRAPSLVGLLGTEKSSEREPSQVGAAAQESAHQAVFVTVGQDPARGAAPRGVTVARARYNWE